jgi:hypothetical protein
MKRTSDRRKDQRITAGFYSRARALLVIPIRYRIYKQSALHYALMKTRRRRQRAFAQALRAPQ